MAADSLFTGFVLQCLYWQAEAASLSLSAALKATALGQYSVVKPGKVVIATSAAGRTVQFEIPDADGVGPAEMARVIFRLVKLSASVLSALVSAGIATPTDAQIHTEMQSRLEPVTESRSDFIGLRVGHGTPVTITAA